MLQRATTNGQPYISRFSIFTGKISIKHLVVIEGPTASGKTSLSIALAKHFNTCVISSDSRQFYKEMAIGTAKPSIEEQDGVVHHFVDSHTIEDEVSSARYEREALLVLKDEFTTKDVVIMAGGSGMFIDAVCIGLDDIPSSTTIRDEIQAEYDTNGLADLLNELKNIDPDYYETVDRQNPMRIIRALEVIRLTGQPYSTLRKKKPAARPFQVHRFVIEHDREALYDRINRRVDIMMEEGLLEEVKSLLPYRDRTSLNTVGYKELFNYIDGKLSLEEATDMIKQNTRRYAKRQLTWFRRHEEANWISYGPNEEMVNKILLLLESQFSANEGSKNLE